MILSFFQLHFFFIFYFVVFHSRAAHLNSELTRRNNERGISDSENGIQSEITYLNLPYFFFYSLNVLAMGGDGKNGKHGIGLFFSSFQSGFACE